MAKSARKLLELDPVMTVTVKAVKQITPGLVFLSFNLNRVRYDDVYNVTPSDMKLLLKALSGKKVKATLSPDDSEDMDGHPSVEAVVV